MADTTPNNQGTVLSPEVQRMIEWFNGFSPEAQAEFWSQFRGIEQQRELDSLAAQEDLRREIERQLSQPKKEDYGIPEWDDR